MTTQGEVFARAITARDAGALRAVLADSVAFEALTPGRHWASTDADEVVDKIILGPWFGTHQGDIELCSVSTGQAFESSAFSAMNASWPAGTSSSG